MKKPEPGYPLPAGGLGEDEIVCQLVYLPDRPEYWQALFAAVHYFSTWRAWERDEGKRGKDAAANWREAFELTMGCWRMTCLEDLKADVAGILALLQGKKDCCDDNVTYGPQREVETEIDPGVGDPPELYGETEVEDWDEWMQHVCYNAHKYVDAMILQADTFSDAVGNSFLTLGLIAAALAILSFTGIGLPVAYALAAIALVGLLDAGVGAFLTAGDDIEDARQEIVCVFLQGTSVRDAVEDALGDSSAEWLLFQLVDYESATAIVYEGGYDGEYLPADKKEDCLECGYDQVLEEDFTLHIPYGSLVDYDDGVWTVESQLFACHQIWLQFYTTPSKVVWKELRIQYLSCTASVNICGATVQHQGSHYIDSPPNAYEVNHPSLPGVGDGVISSEYVTHNEAFVISFMLYLP